MKIAVLGWGSLIWNPKNLKIKNSWFKDGPYLPVEFARISNDERLTLVLHPNAEKVQVLWAYMDLDDLDEAIENLTNRERTINGCIGFIDMKSQEKRCNAVPECFNDIKQWARKICILSLIHK